MKPTKDAYLVIVRATEETLNFHLYFLWRSVVVVQKLTDNVTPN